MKPYRTALIIIVCVSGAILLILSGEKETSQDKSIHRNDPVLPISEGSENASKSAVIRQPTFNPEVSAEHEPAVKSHNLTHEYFTPQSIDDSKAGVKNILELTIAGMSAKKAESDESHDDD